MSSPSVPRADAIRQVLGDLFNKPVVVKPAAARMPAGTAVYRATYIDDAGAVRGLCLCDVPLAATIAAALVMLPAAVAAESVRKGVLPPEMVENLYEVLNVLSQTFCVVHHRIRDVAPPKAAVAADVAPLLEKPSARMDLDIAVTGYANGRMTLLSR